MGEWLTAAAAIIPVREKRKLPPRCCTPARRAAASRSFASRFRRAPIGRTTARSFAPRRAPLDEVA